MFKLFFSNTSFVFLALLCQSASARVVSYEFDIDNINVNYTGTSIQAVTIDRQLPGPTLTATVGDTLRVTFNNKMSEASSIHWHGILLPNDQDGVPHLTTPSIPAGGSFTYEYPVTHSGTYWYHSHTGLQEQRGAYGAMKFLPKTDPYNPDHDYMVVISDWTDEDPNKVLSHIKRDGDYYALKKNSVQSWDRVIANGKRAIQNRLYSAWTRMGPMDISDIGYDAFLLNGQRASHFSQAKPGEEIRLRVVNASASSYQYLQFAGGPMTIIATDGVDIEPLKVDKLRIAIAETYDVLITLPDHKQYEFRASSEDGTGYSSLFIGNGDKVSAPTILRPNLSVVDHNMHMHHHHSGAPGADTVLPMLNEYTEIRSLTNTRLSEERPLTEVTLRLTGNMERYSWSFNNETLSEVDSIKVTKGDRVRFKLYNDTMMHHPVHLHGHFFRVLNGQGDYSPLKHTVNVPAMGAVTIEFAADEEKDWFFHCHNLYHMKSGMARVVSYNDTSNYSPAIRNKIAHDTAWYQFFTFNPQSNMAIAKFRASNTRNALSIEADYGYEKSYEAELIYERNLSRFMDFYAGMRPSRDEEGARHHDGIVGFHAVFPMLIEVDLRYATDNAIRAAFSSELQLTKRLKLDWMWATDDEYHHELSYEFNKSLLLTFNIDSEYAAGAGFMWRF